MRGAASLRKKRQTHSLPPTCTQLVLCEKGKFSLDGSFFKNAPYKQKIILPRSGWKGNAPRLPLVFQPRFSAFRSILNAFKLNGKQIWVAENIEQLCPSMVQDSSATPGSKIGVERQVVIFTRHKLVEYVRNSAPDVMPLQKHKHSHLRKGADNLQDCLPQKGILLKYIYMISGQSWGIPFSSGPRKYYHFTQNTIMRALPLITQCITL